MAKGGLTVGKSHEEGGIPMTVKSTGQKIEVEGGELIVNKHNSADPTTFEFEGEEKTTCEIVSELNSRNGNGVNMDCDSIEGKKYKYEEGGKVEMKNNSLYLGDSYLSYYIDSDDSIVIKNIKSYNKGDGSKLIQAIKDIALDQGRRITLYSEPQDDSIEQEKLNSFYEKHGFELHPDDVDNSYYIFREGGFIRKGGVIKSRLFHLKNSVKGLDKEERKLKVLEFVSKHLPNDGAVTEEDKDVIKISEATNLDPIEVRLIINAHFSPISGHSLNEFVRNAINETGDLTSYIDKILASDYYKKTVLGLQARYIRQNSIFEQGGIINPYSICTNSIGKKVSTENRSEWNQYSKNRYDKCLSDIEIKEQGGVIKDNEIEEIEDLIQKDLDLKVKQGLKLIKRLTNGR